MGFRRLLCAVIVCAAAGGVLSGRALAVTAPLPDCTQMTQPNVLQSAHFRVFYDSDPTAADYMTETQAGDLMGSAEQAYAGFAAQGCPTPVDDGSGFIEINVMDLSTWGISSLTCFGSFDYDSGSIGAADEAMSTAWDVFQQVEYNLYPDSDVPDYWLTNAAAQWAAAQALGYPASAMSDIGPADMALDCFDPHYDTGFQRCSENAYEDGALSRWPFYEYLAERFGRTFIDEVLADAETAGSSYTGLSNALVAHGTTFPAVFNAWTTTELTGAYTAPGLKGTAPTAHTKVSTGINAGQVASLQVPVNHLATRYVEFDRGNADTTIACYSATLSLSVTIPAGTQSQPTFYWTGPGGSAIPLAVNGSTASASIPWDTCTWAGSIGLLSLPNASTNVNSANFVITASMTVDLTKPTAALLPPAPVSVNTPVVSAPSTDAAPLISVFGPELLKLSATDRQIRLIVQSTGGGTLEASLGAVSLGSSSLRPGNNDVRYTLPKSLVSALRRTAATSNVLTLTPVSTGGVSGAAVTRKISIAPAATKTVKPKAKPKAKAKPKKHK
jgi:hypothetical protein